MLTIYPSFHGKNRGQKQGFVGKGGGCMSIFFVKTVGGDLSGKFDKSRSNGEAFIYAQGKNGEFPVASVLPSRKSDATVLDPFKVAENLVDVMNGGNPRHILGVQLSDPAWVRKPEEMEIILMPRLQDAERHGVTVRLQSGLSDDMRDDVAEKLTNHDNVSRYMKSFEALPYQPTVKAAPTVVEPQ